MHREHQREAVFKDDEDQQEFLATLGEACRKTEWPAAASFLPRRAVCNLENQPVVSNYPLLFKDAWWGRRARVYLPRGSGGCVRPQTTCGGAPLPRPGCPLGTNTGG
jgi:hypothetical protein